MEILISGLNSAHHNAFSGKAFFIISMKIEIWQLHKNNALGHSEMCSEFCSSGRFQRQLILCDILEI